MMEQLYRSTVRRMRGGRTAAGSGAAMSRRALVICTAALTLAACATQITEPPPDQSSAHGLDVALTVNPAEVAQDERFIVELTVTNTRPATVRLTTSHGCLALPGIYRNGQRIPFEGSGWACRAAITTHAIAPGETVTRSWEMVPRLYAEHPGDPDGVPAPRGAYTARAVFEVFEVDGERGTLPTVERTLHVR
jgi:hypothetical protein